MLSKEWKLALVLPLAASLLTACGSEKKEENKTHPFAGTWVQQQALDDYEQIAVKKRDRKGFCAAAFSSDLRAQHGVVRNRKTAKYSFTPNALTIENTGEVKTFKLDETGSQAAGAVSPSGAYIGKNSSGKVPTKAELEIKDGVMVISDLTTLEEPPFKPNYVNAGRAKVTDYVLLMVQCLNSKNKGKKAIVDMFGNYRTIDAEEDLPELQGPGGNQTDLDLAGGKDGDDEDPLGPPDLSDDEIFLDVE
jgi:hypothetical protein